MLSLQPFGEWRGAVPRLLDGEGFNQGYTRRRRKRRYVHNVQIKV
jgi:hypothetical protein